MTPKLIFFGTDEFAVAVLSYLLDRGMRPVTVITTPDKPAGKKQELTPPPVKTFCLANNLSFIQPDRIQRTHLKNPDPRCVLETLPDLALVASYGKILPKAVIDLPKHGTLNIHPSLLPVFRGPAPIQNTILTGAVPGVTIMQMDEEVDHGPIISQKAKIKSQNLAEEKSYPELRDELAKLGAELFLEILPDYLAGKVKPSAQDHTQATFTKKITKEDGQLDLNADPLENYRKFLAYQPWPGTYFFTHRHGKNIRVKIIAAHLAADQFVLDSVIPEGRKEMSWEDFNRGQ